MKVKNSLSTFLEQAMVLSDNSMEILDKVSDAVTSSKDTVVITLTDPRDPNNTVEYSVPSIGYLKEEIERLSATLETMANVSDTTGSTVRLSDGTYRRIIASKLPSEAPTITSVGSITNFNFKSNWFFEDMLNPSLYVTWDMSGQISDDTENVMVQRYILKCDDARKINLFNREFKGRNDIDYRNFISVLLNNGIKYIVDDEIKSLPPRSKRYYGTFSVIRVLNEKDSNGNNVKRYILDSLEFSDSKSGFENTRILAVGDYVEVNTYPVTTKYEVVFVDNSEKKIGLRCVEGCEGVRIGANTLKVSSSNDRTVNVDVPIGFGEREVIFIKPIDADSNIPSNKWSPGVGFYTNELTYVASDGTTQTLQRFYQRNVVDFGQVLLSYATDYYPTSREGIKPNAPVLNYSSGEGDFRVVQINNQLTEVSDSEEFRSLVSEKARVQSEVDNYTSEIAKKKREIQTTKYPSENDKLKAQSELNTLIENQSTSISEFNSIVNNIKSKYEMSISSEPKYRVRGFWSIPPSKISPSSGEQKIIKFKIRYRYLSASGNANREEEFTYMAGSINALGRFSNWNEIETKTRPRVKTSNGWEWEDIDTSNPDVVNINQLDIPINNGEQVEIQVRSVSEAGWPSNPLLSDWSNSVIVSFADFPELQADDVSKLIEQNKVDAAMANIQRAFSGTTEHLNTSFYTNDKYFAHTAETITSGFLSPEQTPITLYDKLQEINNQLTLIMEYINYTVGEIDVVLIENAGELNQKIHTLNAGETTYINAGNYLSELAGVKDEDRRGYIVEKTFYLDISTNVQSGLYLVSKLNGNRMSMCPSTINLDKIEYDGSESEGEGNLYGMYDNVVFESSSSSVYYMEQGRYDLVPINLTNSDTLDFQVCSTDRYQSAQCKGQFVYSRFRNIGDTFDMYANCSDAKFKPESPFLDSEVYGFEVDESSPYKPTPSSFADIIGCEEIDIQCVIKDGGNDGENQFANDILNRLPKTWEKPNLTISSRIDRISVRVEKVKENVRGGTSSGVGNVPAMAERYAERIKKLTVSDSSYSISPKIQSAYGFADMGTLLVKKNNYESYCAPEDHSYYTTHKIGYESKDRYAIGSETCTSYLFLSPRTHNDIQVDGDSMGSYIQVKSGTSLRVPIIFQYRMTDRRGSIFGYGESEELDQDDLVVKNTKYANIIGLDIWSDRNAMTPKQYDVVVYATYDTTNTVNNDVNKTSDQMLVDAGTGLALRLNRMVNESKSLTNMNVNK